jgi:hypothetical protein
MTTRRGPETWPILDEDFLDDLGVERGQTDSR